MERAEKEMCRWRGHKQDIEKPHEARRNVVRELDDGENMTIFLNLRAQGHQSSKRGEIDIRQVHEEG